MTKLKDIVLESSMAIKLVGLVVAVVVFMYTTFATIDYVDAKHTAGMSILKQISNDIGLIKKCVLSKKCE